MAIKHSATKAHGDMGQASEWNADHVIDSDVDFGQYKAIKLVADQGAAWPAGPVEGQIFYRTDLDEYFVWTGAAWTQLGGVGAEPHARQHALSSVLDHTGSVTDAQHGVRALANAHAHGDISGVTANQHHAEAHTLASHTTKAHTELTDVTADQHHARSHALSSALDHSVPVANIDFDHYQGVSFVVEKGAAFPAGPVAGQIFYRTDLKWLYVYDGASWVSSGGAPQKLEFYDAGDDTAWSLWGVTWPAQTFTVGTVGINVPFTTYSVKLKLWRNGSPGTMTVSIRATGVDGKPTGADLATGSIDGNALTSVSPGLWYEIPLTSATLSAATKYAIVVRCPDGGVLDYVAWRNDQTAPSYAGGSVVDSEDSGSTWTIFAGRDFMFEVWGRPA